MTDNDQAEQDLMNVLNYMHLHSKVFEIENKLQELKEILEDIKPKGKKTK